MNFKKCAHQRQKITNQKQFQKEKKKKMLYIWIDIHSAPLALQEEYVYNGSKHNDYKSKNDPNNNIYIYISRRLHSIYLIYMYNISSFTTRP